MSQIAGAIELVGTFATAAGAVTVARFAVI